MIVYSDDCDCESLADDARIPRVEDLRTELEVRRRFAELFRLWAVVSDGSQSHRHLERYVVIHHRGRHVLWASPL